ncbi:DUF5765 domain-containing protein [Nanoarchaeota archaeon]
MCWSFGAAGILAIFGFVVAIYLAYKKRSKLLWIPIIYFSLMELLQAVTYPFIGQCDLPINQILAFLGFIHITFQPFFVNALTMYFIPKHVREKIQGWVYTVCFISAIIMLTKLYPFDWAGQCAGPLDSRMCGPDLCSIWGEWHLAWHIPLNGIEGLTSWGYTLPVFILPLIYGAWRILGYIAIAPLLANLTTSSLTEEPAVWCLFSVAFLVVVFIKPLMKWLHVKKWYFWKYPFKKS